MSFQMRNNYIMIKKSCIARDRHLDGWIKIEDLKAILDQFAIPMSDQLFAQLMDRLVYYCIEILSVVIYVCLLVY